MPVLYSGGSAASLTLTDFCGADASTASAAPFTFSPKCKGTSETEGDNPGETPAFNIAGTGVGVLNDDIFPLYLDYDGPSAPTFYPNPNKREGGWVNLTVDFLGEQKSGNKDGWLNYNSDDAGVGGYQPVLRYAEVPKWGGLEEALAAPILTLANLPGESEKADAYCAVVSAVDLLGNESDPGSRRRRRHVHDGPGRASVEPAVDPDGTAAATGYHLLLEMLRYADENFRRREDKAGHWLTQQCWLVWT